MTSFTFKYRKLSILFFLFFSTFLAAQNQEFIAGKLIDAQTQEPIAFASIRIKDRALGMISNTDGSFKVPLKYKEYGNIIEISSMGYQSVELIIHDFLIDEINFIELQPSAFQLQEALVLGKKRNQKNISAEKIVQNAIDRILDNYPIEPYSQIGYYRDYQLDNTQYINLNEAILEVYDEGFNTYDALNTKVVLFDYKQNTDFSRNLFAEKPYDFNKGNKIIDKAYLPSYGGNEFTILNVHNAIRNYNINTYSFANYFESDFLKQHTFWKEDNTYIDDKILYTIKFKKLDSDAKAFGTIIIAKEDYSIYKLEYALYDGNKRNTSGLADKNGMKTQLIFEVNTEYQKINNRMFLNYISFHNTFKLQEPPKLVLQGVELDVDNKLFLLTFSQELIPVLAQRVRNFEITFEGERLVIEKVDLLKNKVFLYPKLDKQRFKNLFNRVLAKASLVALSETALKIEVKNLEDIHGNEINKWTNNYFNQFREFFVQQIKPNNRAPLNIIIFMDRGRPIFKYQPFYKPPNFSDYWMNTPLRTLQN